MRLLLLCFDSVVSEIRVESASTEREFKSLSSSEIIAPHERLRIYLSLFLSRDARRYFRVKKRFVGVADAKISGLFPTGDNTVSQSLRH